MSVTTLIIVRHGEVNNPQNVLYGRLPGFGITQTGIQQIRNTLSEIKNYLVSAIYCSPLLRARQSVAVFAGHFKHKPKISFHFNEVNLIFDGMSLKQYKSQIQPRLYMADNIEKGQESITQIKDRMLKFVFLVKKRHALKTVLAVSHGDPIVILKSALESMNFTWQYKKNNYLQTGRYFIFSL